MQEEQPVVKWVVPAAYSRFSIDEEVRYYARGLASALLRVGLPLCVVCLLGLLWARGLMPPSFAVKAVVLFPLGVIWLTGFPVVPFWLRRFGVQHVKATRRDLRFGWKRVAVGQVNWYRLTSVDRFPGLRALEIGTPPGKGCETGIRSVRHR